MTVALVFKLPDIGEGLAEADVLRWYVNVGDVVGLDEPLVELETAKAVVEMPAPRAGTVLHHGAAAGETIAVGDVLAVIGEPGEAWESGGEGASGGSRPQAAAERRPGQGTPLVGTLVDDAEELPSRHEDSSTVASRPQALPLVRRLARETGVDLREVVGTGPSGRITRSDLESHIAARTAQSSGQSASAEPGTAFVGGVPATEDGAADVRRRMSMVRRTIAEHMVRSWREIPHVTTFDDVDASRLLEVRRALMARRAGPIPIEAFVGLACVRAIREVPWFNASVEGEDIVEHGAVHLGVAVDTPEGLVVPVLRDAHELSLLELADAITALGERAKQRNLSPSETVGSTFTVSNIGAVGGTHGTPIIPYGTTAILSVGRAADKPVAIGGDLGVLPMMPLSLSYDHRVIDGAMGRRFLSAVMADLAEPALFLI
jgi:pyruvate dehydrogenase E2 component (dihydrolipoamide acetyltransferase)